MFCLNVDCWLRFGCVCVYIGFGYGWLGCGSIVKSGASVAVLGKLRKGLDCWSGFRYDCPHERSK